MTRTLTAQQVAARDARRARFRELAGTVGRMSDAERIALAGTLPGVATVEGHALSVGNACLLACQCPSATIVAGFRQWKAAGRSVRAGEHGLMIWAPVRGRETNGGPTEADLDSDRPRFVVVTVFDVSQTDAVEGRAA